MSKAWIMCSIEVFNLLWLIMENVAILRTHVHLEDIMSKVVISTVIPVAVIGVTSVVLRIISIIKENRSWMATVANVLTALLLLGNIVTAALITHQHYQNVFGYHFNAELPWLAIFVLMAESLTYFHYLKYSETETNLTIYLHYK